LGWRKRSMAGGWIADGQNGHGSDSIWPADQPPDHARPNPSDPAGTQPELGRGEYEMLTRNADVYPGVVHSGDAGSDPMRKHVPHHAQDAKDGGRFSPGEPQPGQESFVDQAAAEFRLAHHGPAPGLAIAGGRGQPGTFQPISDGLVRNRPILICAAARARFSQPIQPAVSKRGERSVRSRTGHRPAG